MTAPIRPKVREDLGVVELDGEAVIYDERNGSLHHLNPTATLVFSLCDGTSTIKQMAGDIAQAYQVPLSEVEKQLRKLIRDFRGSELIEPHAAGAANGNGKNGR